MLTANQLHGCLPAIITPMSPTSDGMRIDVEHFKVLLARIIDAGCTGVVIGGTTGQSAALDLDELTDLAASGATFARAYAKSRKTTFRVIVATGSNDTRRAIKASRAVIEAARPDALLHVTGYYNNPPQEGLVRHFTAVADACGELGVPIIIYNVPTRTKSNLLPPAAATLSKHAAIIGLKEASGDLAQVRAICQLTAHADFSIMSGEDGLVADIMAMGGRGVISATANRWPREFQRLTELMVEGRAADARMLQLSLLPCVRATLAAKNPIPLHYMFKTGLRLPMVTVEELEPETRRATTEIIHEALAIREFPFVERRSFATESSLDEGTSLQHDAPAITGEVASL